MSEDQKNRSAERFVLAASSVIFVLACLYPFVLPELLEWGKGYHPPNKAHKTAFLLKRLESYKLFLFMCAGALFLYWVGLRKWIQNRGNQLSEDISPGKVRTTVLLVFSTTLLIVGYYFSNLEWTRWGSPCWDNYCWYALRFHKFFFSYSAENTASLLEFISKDYHANSPLVPVLTAITSQLTGLGILPSYRLTSALATIACLAITWRYLLPNQSFLVRLTVLVCLGSHLGVVRSFAFPQTDPNVMLWATAVVALGFSFIKQPKLATGISCFALLSTGLFIKLSFLPVLSLIPLWFLSQSFSSSNHQTSENKAAVIKRFVILGLVFSLVPLGLYLNFQSQLDLLTNYGTEFKKIQTYDSTLSFHLEVLLKSTAAFLLPLWIAFSFRQGDQLKLFIWVLIYVFSLWIMDTSGWMRLYIPIVPAVAAMSAAGFSRLQLVYGNRALYAYMVLVVTLHYTALAIGMYG